MSPKTHRTRPFNQKLISAEKRIPRSIVALRTLLPSDAIYYFDQNKKKEMKKQINYIYYVGKS